MTVDELEGTEWSIDRFVTIVWRIPPQSLQQSSYHNTLNDNNRALLGAQGFNVGHDNNNITTTQGFNFGYDNSVSTALPGEQVKLLDTTKVLVHSGLDIITTILIFKAPTLGIVFNNLCNMM